MRNFRREIFFRIPSCLGQLIPSYKYFVLTILFLINYFLKINTFSAQLLFRTSFFFRISNYSEYVLFRSGAFCGQLLFQKRNLFRGRYFLIKSLFLLVLRNQFHSIYTWKDLTSIHFFKHSMVRSSFEIPQFFIVENSKQPINFNSVTNVYFWKPGSNFGIFKRPSKSGTCGSKAKSS